MMLPRQKSFVRSRSKLKIKVPDGYLAQTPKQNSSLENLLVPKHPITLAQEIYQQEDQEFFGKYLKSSHSSFSLKSGNLVNTSISPVRNSTLFEPPVKTQPAKKVAIPKIALKFSKASKLRKCDMLDNLIKECEKSGKNNPRSVSLHKSIGTDVQITGKYVKKINWVASKYNEFACHREAILKKMIKVSKFADEINEEERLKAIDRITNISLQEYKNRARHIKTTLAHYKDRLFH